MALRIKKFDPTTIGHGRIIFIIGKRNTGKSLIAFVNEARITIACRLMMTSDAPIGELAFQAGFPNLSHFNRLFLRQMEVTPREFRRQSGRGGPGREHVEER